MSVNRHNTPKAERIVLISVLVRVMRYTSRFSRAHIGRRQQEQNRESSSINTSDVCHIQLLYHIKFIKTSYRTSNSVSLTSAYNGAHTPQVNGLSSCRTNYRIIHTSGISTQFCQLFRFKRSYINTCQFAKIFFMG